MPDNIPQMSLSQYWIYLVMGDFLGVSGYLYGESRSKCRGKYMIGLVKDSSG